MSNKLTQKVAFTELLSVVENSALSVADKELYTEFLKGRLVALEKKAKSAKGSETATQKANAVLKEEILNAMAEGVKYTVTEMIKQFDFLADCSNQKVSALMKQLVDGGEVVKSTEKRKSYFSLA